MPELNLILIVIVTGIMAVSIIDVVGSIASRRLNFDYGWFAILSIIVYTYIGYYLAKKTSFEITLITALIVGIYDGIVGHKISQKLKANVRMTDDEKEVFTPALRLTTILVLVFICTYVSYSIGNK